MSTKITINVSGNRLLQQSREAQAANRQQLTQKQVDDKFVADVRQIEATAPPQREGAVPEYGIQEQTSAQRGGLVLGAFGLILNEIPVDGSAPGLLLTAQKTQREIILGEPYTSFLQRLEETNPENAYKLINFQDENTLNFTIEPVEGFAEYRVDRYRVYDIIGLPAGKDKFVICFVERFGYASTEVPPLNFPENGELQPTRTAFGTYHNVQCFLFTSRSIREIACPNQVKELFAAIYPETAPSYQQLIVDSINNMNQEYQFNVTLFDDSVVRTGGIYGQLASNINIAYGRNFGMGLLTENSHFEFSAFTPGVFKWLDGSLEGFTSSLYSDYRSQFYSNAPNSYIDTTPPIANDPATPAFEPLIRPAIRTLGFTNTMPVASDAREPEENFIYRKIKGLSDHLVWDWNNPNYCRSELSKLGFTAADLTP